ncbi:unnamed protein product [Cylindrotheca closterium]|uniref:Uncharacterized protein n=1 Tax=Cylindrotheca closterium TaxID=2856 RepID=A0AAD2CLF3_9STRA|nr:unnamed protein product [Cylindrotheca closterium]
MRVSITLVSAVLLALENTSAWLTPHVSPSPIRARSWETSPTCSRTKQEQRRNRRLLMADVDTGDDSTLADEEWSVIANLYQQAAGNPSTLSKLVLEALPTLNPSLIMKLRGAILDSRDEFVAVQNALNSVLDARLAGARDVLFEFLNAGEIRKLDSLIGKAARDGKLDVAFFQVLNMNLQDASQEQADDGDENTANRFQILQHIYTRCQEEVEKTIPPGVALLNKLLRTDSPSIRSNQLVHYLCPQSNVITAPDGKEVKLEGREKILVSHADFVGAIGNAVIQIRNVEKAGAANREVSANMVEAVRTVAKEARVTIADKFGVESKELQDFEAGLMPVFRPSSPESSYIKGE